MAIDMSQFRQVFFEESLEGLEAMESSLLQLDEGHADDEVINTIFRAAHSIKGGSATFGMPELASFTHVLESLLDDMRSGRRQVSQHAVGLLLQSVDVLRGMLVAYRDGTPQDQARISQLQRELETLWQAADGPAVETPGVPQLTASGAGPEQSWQITFRPYPTMLRAGNDPVRMLRELETLGTLTVQADLSGLPSVRDMDPATCYLSWSMTLSGCVTQEQITAIFEWVEGDCELTVTSLTGETAAAEPLTPVLAAPPGGRERRTGEERRTGQERRQGGQAADTNSIRVGIDKIDALINTVGELVITQAMLSQLRDGFDMHQLDKLRDGIDQLERNTRELQESVMSIRMLPISFAFNRFPRLVHDLSQQLNKRVQLKISGEQTELDKTVMEKIGDPLLHLVRNALDHGLEAPEVRVDQGKPDTGLLHLNAYHQGGAIVIEVSDDGAGLNRDRILHKAVERGLVGADDILSDEKIYDLIFEAGFSTAETVSEISGRGVGMDVVRRNISDLGGTIEVLSMAGRGTTFTIRLPLTLAILDGQLVRVRQETYIVPLVSIAESLQIDLNLVHSVAGQSTLYRLREDYIPIVRTCDLFNVPGEETAGMDSLLVVVENAGQKIGLVVDELLGQQQVVIKSLETNFRRVEGVSGATILGDGTVALILDIAGLLRLSHSGIAAWHPQMACEPQAA
ncbi:MAG: chemotaxis protein CheA [Candidatus Tectimicrobiota bacterium]